MKKVLFSVLGTLLLLGVCYAGYLIVSELNKDYITNSQGRLFLRDGKLFYNGSRKHLQCDDQEIQEVADPLSLKIISWQDISLGETRGMAQDTVMKYELKEELVIFSPLPDGRNPGCGWLITIEPTNKDITSFTILNKYYSKDKNSVYFYNGFDKSTEVVGADPETFEVMEDSTEGKDKNGMYIGGAKWK